MTPVSGEGPVVRLYDVHVTGDRADESAVRAAIERAVAVAAGRGQVDADGVGAQITTHLAGQVVDGTAGQVHADQQGPRRGTP